jgi:hypothetical protein
MDWWILLLMTVLFIVSIYLIAKGLEIALRGMKPANPNRSNDLLLGAMMLVPGVALGAFGFFWLLPYFSGAV